MMSELDPSLADAGLGEDSAPAPPQGQAPGPDFGPGPESAAAGDILGSVAGSVAGSAAVAAAGSAALPAAAAAAASPVLLPGGIPTAPPPPPPPPPPQLLVDDGEDGQGDDLALDRRLTESIARTRQQGREAAVAGVGAARSPRASPKGPAAAPSGIAPSPSSAIPVAPPAPPVVPPAAAAMAASEPQDMVKSDSMSSRWIEFEADQAGLDAEASRATTAAVASASERYARRSVQQDMVRAQALRILEIAGGGDGIGGGGVGGGAGGGGGGGGGGAGAGDDDDPVSPGLSRTGTGGYAYSLTGGPPQPTLSPGGGGGSPSSASSRRSLRRHAWDSYPSSPAGTAGTLGSTPSPPSRTSRYRDRALSVEEDPNVDELRRMAAERVRAQADGHRAAGQARSESWSSRYSVDRHLTFLQKPDPGGGVGYGGGGGGGRPSSVRHGGAGQFEASSYDDFSHRAAQKVRKFRISANWWDNVDARLKVHDGAGSLPSPPHSSQVGNYLVTEEIHRMWRKRVLLGLLFGVCFVAIVAYVYGTSFPLGSPGGGPVTFYVTSDVPLGEGDEGRFKGYLADLPDDADFVVHLGDLALAKNSNCEEQTYEHAASMMSKNSPAPVFVVPGNEDWNECPAPEAALDRWLDHFSRFEDNFKHPFEVSRQLGREENFSFLHRGVLFIGLHLVDGTVPEQVEWNLRTEECVEWTEENLAMTDEEDYRAVVLLGHAEPTSEQLGDYFWPIVDDLNGLGKPVLYVHGKSMQGFNIYHPFSAARGLTALELDPGGSAPPAKIRIGMGAQPFQIDRRRFAGQA